MSIDDGLEPSRKATRKRPTRADVAKLAGVAPSTVSLILGDNGKRLNIPAATQDRVREAARDLGYYPNKLIKAVLNGRSGIIGLYLRWEQWASPIGYFRQVVWGIESALSGTEYSLLTYCAPYEVSAEEIYARQAGGIVDGILIMESGQDEIVPRLIEARLPAVEVGDTFGQIPFVGSEGSVGVRLALDHLKERGYMRPAYGQHLSRYAQEQQSRARAFVEYGSELWGRDLGGSVLAIEPGIEPFALFESLPERPDCIVCASDEMAYDFLGWCMSRGVRVPEDLAVVGFDALKTYVRYPVTTSVETPIGEMTRLAVKKLLAVIDGEPYEHGTVLTPGLRIGDTT